jgi:hypothetical protein
MTLFSNWRRRGLLEATYEKDAAVRAVAKQQWSRIVRYLKSVASSLNADLRPTNLGRAMVGFALPEGAAGLADDVKVVLAPEVGNSTMTYLGPNVVPSYVITLSGALKSSYSTEKLIDRLDRMESVFVHEFVHYLDYKRGLKKARLGKAHADPKTDRPGYMQSPAEFNAWFQDSAHSIEGFVTSALQGTATHGGTSGMGRMFVQQLRRQFESFEAFKAFSAMYADQSHKDSIAALAGSKWEKKWERRMYTLYQGLKAKVDEALKDVKSEGVVRVFSGARRRELEEAAELVEDAPASYGPDAPIVKKYLPKKYKTVIGSDASAVQQAKQMARNAAEKANIAIGEFRIVGFSPKVVVLHHTKSDQLAYAHVDGQLTKDQGLPFSPFQKGYVTANLSQAATTSGPDPELFQTGAAKLDAAVSWLLQRSKEKKNNEGSVDYFFQGRLPQKMVDVFSKAADSDGVLKDQSQSGENSYLWQGEKGTFQFDHGAHVQDQRMVKFRARAGAAKGQAESVAPPAAITKKGDVWTFVVDGTKVVLDKAQRTALRSFKAGSTNPQRFKQLEKRGLVVRFGERQANKQWVSGKTSTQITGYLSPLGEKVFALMQQELGAAP